MLQITYKLGRTFKFCQVCCRSLFTEESLGLKSFQKWCADRRQMCGRTEANIQRQTPCLSTSELNISTQTIFTDDIKNAIAYAEDSKLVDFEKLHSLYVAYHRFWSEWNISTFPLAPSLLRLCYSHEKPDAALKLMLDENLAPAFDQLSCYQLCADLLFESGRFDDVLKLWNYFRINSSVRQTIQYPRSFLILLYASAYESNTKDSCDRALALYKEIRQTGYSLPRRAVVFLSALCLRQNLSALAYELLCTVNCDDFALGRTLKIILLTHLDRLPEISAIFSRVLFSDFSTVCSEDFEVSTDVLALLERSIDESGNQDLKRIIQEQISLLRKGGHLVNVTLDQLLKSPIALATSSIKHATEDEDIELPSSPASLPASNVREDKQNLLAYCNDTNELATVSKFVESEKRSKRKEQLLKAVANKVARDGPFRH